MFRKFPLDSLAPDKTGPPPPLCPDCGTSLTFYTLFGMISLLESPCPLRLKINQLTISQKEFSSGLGNPSAPKTALAKWLFATILASQVTHGVLNLSVVLSYRKLFTSPLAGQFALVSSIWLASWAVSSVAFAAFMCTPPGDFWTDMGSHDGCVSSAEIELYLVTFDVVHAIFAVDISLAFSSYGEPSGGRLEDNWLGACVCDGIWVSFIVLSFSLIFAPFLLTTLSPRFILHSFVLQSYFLFLLLFYFSLF